MEHLHQALSGLPANNLTVKLVRTASSLTGAEWENVTDLEQMIRQVTGESDQKLVQTIGERAVKLFADPSERYHRAMRVYRLVDSLDKLVGAGVLVDQIGQRVSFLKFLEKLVPKDEKLQAIDAGAKLLAELVAFTSINGLPGDSVGDFARSLANSAREDRVRIATWVVVEGVLPFGPDFLQIVERQIASAGSGDLQQSALFQKVGEAMPDTSPDQRKNLLLRTLSESGGWMRDLVSSRGLTREGVGQKLSSIVEIGDKGLDIVAAAIDAGTNYFEHTGTQSVARQIVKRAYGEI
jgi:hypothetical protein